MLTAEHFGIFTWLLRELPQSSELCAVPALFLLDRVKLPGFELQYYACFVAEAQGSLQK